MSKSLLKEGDEDGDDESDGDGNGEFKFMDMFRLS